MSTQSHVAGLLQQLSRETAHLVFKIPGAFAHVAMISDAAVKAALGGWQDAQHKKECDGKGCFRCAFLARKQVLEKIHAWVSAKFHAETNTWGLGCRVCHEVCAKDVSLMNMYRMDKHHFAKFQVCSGDLRLQRFQKHATSPSHAAAVRFLEGGRQKAVEGDQHSCPSQVEWFSVLDSKDPKKVARDKKLNVMRWCLASAFRRQMRDFAREALCISVQQDARGNRFLSRFKMVNAKLDILQGTLSLARHKATIEQPGSVGIRRRTMLALENLANTSLPPTYSSVKPVSAQLAPVDPTVYRDIVAKVECFAADAAADEQVAGRELSSALVLAGPDPLPLQDVMEQSLPNLKVIQRDRAHAAQRTSGHQGWV